MLQLLRTRAPRLPFARDVAASLGGWPARRWLVSALAAGIAGVLMGVPTGLLPTDLYHRMTPVIWWDYPVWAASSVLIGLAAATYLRAGSGEQRCADRSARTLGASILSAFAVGCPVCNKLVVALIGVSGALNYWASLQPALGVLSVALLIWGLVTRLRGQLTCPATAKTGH